MLSSKILSLKFYKWDFQIRSAIFFCYKFLVETPIVAFALFALNKRFLEVSLLYLINHEKPEYNRKNRVYKPILRRPKLFKII